MRLASNTVAMKMVFGESQCIGFGQRGATHRGLHQFQRQRQRQLRHLFLEFVFGRGHEQVGQGHQIASVGMTSDAHHLVIPSPDPTQSIAAMRQALAESRVNPEDVDYVNAHATGTPVGDACEATALRRVFGTHAQDIPVSSTKSMTGHLLGAAAAIEAIACLTAIINRAIPPTINLHRPDPACNLRHVANDAEEHKVRIAMSNSFGFGGHNTCLLLRCA